MLDKTTHKSGGLNWNADALSSLNKGIVYI